MEVLRDLVDDYVVDGRVWYGGVDLTPNQQHIVRAAAIVVFGTLVAPLFQLLFLALDRVSALVVPGYRDQKRMTRVDWTSRWVAMLFIAINTVGLAMIASYEVHDLDPHGDGEWLSTQWVYDKAIPHTFYHVMFWHYVLLFAYELYDLKNCVEIKMYSGVLHHIVLLVIFPICWHVSSMCIPAVWMSTMTYWSNIPAHLRAFMNIMGYRTSRLYELNKHLWWYSYAVLRMFFIPWWSSQVWYTRRPILSQSYVFLLAYYLTSMVIHYSLSLYWFLGMTKSFYPSIPRVESYSKFKDGTSGKSGSSDEGGQKFD